MMGRDSQRLALVIRDAGESRPVEALYKELSDAKRLGLKVRIEQWMFARHTEHPELRMLLGSALLNSLEELDK